VRRKEIAYFKRLGRYGSRAMFAVFGSRLGYFTVYMGITIVHVHGFYVVLVPEQVRQSVCQHREDRAA